MMQSSTMCHSLMNKTELINHVHSHLPASIHMTLNLDKDEYTQSEADEILIQALETWEHIKTLRK